MQDVETDTETVRHMSPSLSNSVHCRLTQDMNRMEQKATEVSNNCRSIINDNNRQLHQALSATEELDRLVRELRSRITDRDKLIKEFEDREAQRHAQAQLGPAATSTSDKHRND